MENPLDGFWMEGDSLAPPCQADQDIVDEIIQLADLTGKSELWDLGCGDGRICITASARSGCRSVGCEIEEKLIEKFRFDVAQANLNDLVTIIHGDLLEVDFSTATVIAVYLLPEAIELLRSKFVAALLRGARIICNTWGPKGLRPIQKIQCGDLGNVTLLVFDSSSIPDVA